MNVQPAGAVCETPTSLLARVCSHITPQWGCTHDIVGAGVRIQWAILHGHGERKDFRARFVRLQVKIDRRSGRTRAHIHSTPARTKRAARGDVNFNYAF
jgi:hypothetical protein